MYVILNSTTQVHEGTQQKLCFMMLYEYDVKLRTLTIIKDVRQHKTLAVSEIKVVRFIESVHYSLALVRRA